MRTPSRTRHALAIGLLALALALTSAPAAHSAPPSPPPRPAPATTPPPTLPPQNEAAAEDDAPADLARLEEEAAAQQAAGDLLAATETLSRRARLALEQGQSEQAVGYMKQMVDLRWQAALADEPAFSTEEMVDLFGAWVDLVIWLQTEGYPNEAIAFLSYAAEVESAITPISHARVAVIAQALGNLYSRQGEYAAALHHYEISLQNAQLIPENAGEFMPPVLESVAATLMEIGDFESLTGADSPLPELLALAEAQGDTESQVVMLTALGSVMAEEGRYATADARLEQAESLATTEQVGDATLLFVYKSIGRRYMGSSDPAERRLAIDYFDKALQVIADKGIDVSYDQGLLYLPCDVLFAAQWLPQAERREIAEEYDPLIEEYLRLAALPVMQSRLTSCTALVQAYRGNLDEAFGLFMESLDMASETDDRVLETSILNDLLNFLDEDGNIEPMEVLVDGLIERYEAEDHPWAQGLEAGRRQHQHIAEFYSFLVDRFIDYGAMADPVDWEMLRKAFDYAEAGRARQFLSAHDTEVRAPVLTLDDVQARLSEDETLVMYYRRNDLGNYVALIATATDYNIWVLDHKTDDLSILLEGWGDAVATQQSGGGESADEGLAHLQAMHEMLIAPIAGFLTTQRLLIVPTGEQLNQTPFPALWDGAQTLGEQHDVALLPSASALATIADNGARAGEPGSALVLSYELASDFGRPLPQARAEAEATAATLDEALAAPGRLLQGRAATEAELRAAAAEYAFLHIAAHGALRTNEIREPLLALGAGGGEDGVLRYSEIAALHLPLMRLVTLSACESAIGEVSATDDAETLAHAFLQAGASSVVSSLWKVPDDATYELMRLFYGRLAAGEGVSHALAGAQTELRTAYPEWSHPFYWAAFVAHGDADPVLP